MSERIQYIAVRVTRNEDGDLEPDRMIHKALQLAGLLEAVSENDGQMVALWARQYPNGESPLSTADARMWTEMTEPNAVYVRAAGGEMIKAADHYPSQLKEDF